MADLDGIRPLRVVAVHRGLLRSARRRPLDAIGTGLRRPPPRPTVILGDFNEGSLRAGLGRVARPFRILPAPASFPSRRPFLTLERIAHAPDPEVAPLGLPRRRGPQASDHLPRLAGPRWT
jgi:endonuclease/exonuclease/phosphatase family metal-dependent hydrolase